MRERERESYRKRERESYIHKCIYIRRPMSVRSGATPGPAGGVKIRDIWASELTSLRAMIIIIMTTLIIIIIIIITGTRCAELGGGWST